MKSEDKREKLLSNYKMHFKRKVCIILSGSVEPYAIKSVLRLFANINLDIFLFCR